MVLMSITESDLTVLEGKGNLYIKSKRVNKGFYENLLNHSG